MDEKHERALRRKAIRLHLQGSSYRAILKRIPRSVGWLSKWWHRYEQLGWLGVKSEPREPKRSPQHYSAHVRHVVIRVRRQLAKRRVGRLIGAHAIQREIRQGRLLAKRERPSESTIKRILHEAGLVKTLPTPSAVYAPRPTATAQFVLQALDWTARYLAGGRKVYAFHTLDLDTYALGQTISGDKSAATAQAHVLKTWQTLGIPDGLQLDNDAAWCGSLKTARYVSRFMRLCLSLGIELIFLPNAEPEFNGALERVNGLWNQQFWKLQHFTTLAHVQRSSPTFVSWYMQHYEPRALAEQTPQAAQRAVTRRRLTTADIGALPDALPLTAGRLHFIRHVDARGDIRVLHEVWHVDKRLRDQYVWATIVLHEHRLDIYFRRSPQHAVRLVKTFRYSVGEPIVPLTAQFTHPHRRRNMFTML